MTLLNEVTRHNKELNRRNSELEHRNNNWQQRLKDNSHYFDYIYLQLPHIAVKYINLVRQYSNAKILYLAHDLHLIREYRECEMRK